MNQNPDESAAPLDGPINILIVDDEPRNLTVLETVLADPDYRLVHAESPDQALLALVAEEFALLILDIQLPGMTGFALAQLIRQRKKSAHVPIIFLTAHYHEDEHVLEGYTTGAVDYLKKPVNRTILRSKVAVFAELHRKTRTLLAEVAARRHAEEMLRALSHQVVQAQEAERGRVALELHDHITQLLCAVVFRSQALAKKLSTRDGPLQRDAIKLSQMLGATAEEVERISRTLRPGVLDELGLVAALRAATTQFAERTGVPVALACAELTERLRADTELALFRIVEQALQNVDTYARARHVSVKLTRSSDFVHLTIKDDGLGFDPDRRALRRNGKNGVGLFGMRERADSVGGTLRITSAPQAGTEVDVRIPVAPAADDNLRPGQ